VRVFHRAWALMALTGASAGLLAVALGRVRARHVGVGAAEEPVVVEAA
jgi:hypothetical protein